MKKYITKSVFLVKVNGRVERIYGNLADAEAFLIRCDAEAFLIRCGQLKNMVIDEWSVEFEE